MKILCIPVGPIQANCYLVSDDQGRACAVDPGAEPERLAQVAQERRLTVTHVLLTHGHIDHLGGAGAFAGLTGALVGCAADAVQLLRHPDPMMPLPGYEDLPGYEADLILADGDVINVGDLRIEVITTPGHSTDGLTFHVDGNLFCGDLLFHGSVGRTDFPGGDFGILLQSVQKLADAFPLSAVVLPGHMEATTLGTELAHNPFLTALDRRG